MGALAVIVDNREPEHIQRQDYGCPTSVALLDAGDIHVATSDALLVVERKSPGDLLASISDGRLFNQVVKMQTVSKWNYIIVTGFLTPTTKGKTLISGHTESDWQWASVQGALTTAQELGTVISYCRNDPMFAHCVARLANRKRGPVYIKPRRDPLIQGTPEEMLSMLPGIGEQRARDLMAYFGTGGYTLCGLTDGQATEVAGIGPTTVKGAREYLGINKGLKLATVSK